MDGFGLDSFFGPCFVNLQPHCYPQPLYICKWCIDLLEYYFLDHPLGCHSSSMGPHPRWRAYTLCLQHGTNIRDQARAVDHRTRLYIRSLPYRYVRCLRRDWTESRRDARGHR